MNSAISRVALILACVLCPVVLGQPKASVGVPSKVRLPDNPRPDIQPSVADSWRVNVAQGQFKDQAFDREGNLIIATEEQVSAGTYNINLRKYDTTPTGTSEQPVLRYGPATALTGSGGQPASIAADSRGRCLVAGTGGSVAMVDANGIRLWVNDVRPSLPGGGGSGTIAGLLVNDDDVPFIFGSYTHSNGSAGVFAASLDPYSGNLRWVIDLTDPQLPDSLRAGALNFIGLGLAPDGRIYVSGDVSGTGYLFVLDGEGGGTVQRRITLPGPTQSGSGSPPEIIVGIDGMAHVLCRGIAYTGRKQDMLCRYDPATDTLRTFQAPNAFGLDGSTFDRCVVDRNGNMYVGGIYHDELMLVQMVGISQDGTRTFQMTFPTSLATTTGLTRTVRMALDGFDKPYIMLREVQTTFANIWLAKVNPRFEVNPTYDLTWTTRETHNADMLPKALSVDNGGNVFAISLQSVNNNYFTHIAKFIQPVAGVPTLVTAHCNNHIEGQSIYGPGPGRFSADANIFDLDLGCGFDEGSFTDFGPLGEWGGRVAFSSAGRLSMGVKAEVSGGDTDLAFPIEAQFQIPDQSLLYIDPNHVTVNTGWKAKPGTARMTTRGEPQFNAGLTYDIYDRLYGLAQLELADDFLVNSEFVNTTLDSPEGPGKDYVPGLNLIDIIERTTGQDLHDWVELEKDGFFLSVRYPQLFAQGTLENSTSTVTRTFKSTANSRFFKGGVNITEAILSAIVGGTQDGDPAAPEELDLITSHPELDLGGPDFRLHLEARIAQLIARCDIGVTQNLTARVTPRLFCRLSDGSTRDINLGGPLGDPNGGAFTFALNPSTWRMDVNPEVYLRIEYTNTTSLDVYPGVEYEALGLGARATAEGITLFDFDECLLCGEEELHIPTPNIYDHTWTVDTPHQKLAPFTVTGSPGSEPRLLGASRTKLPMLIYRQTGPTRSQFNAMTNGTTSMVVYGDRFTVGMAAQLVHQGHVEALTCTYVNPTTARVLVPNWMRLIPGTARLRVTTNGGSSNWIDMPVSLPVPRISTVNPNLWAADPSLADIPIQPIDGYSSTGNDTFVARRDYYVVLRDQLWNYSTARGMSVSQAFPEFNFNSLPPFPAVLIDGKPLPRFVQPVDSGLHNVRLTEKDYDTPRVAGVQLVNPGPGGGASAQMPLNISAPVPVATFVDPPEVMPTSDPFEISVHGPANVPYFPYFEEPKFGNFTKASVVRIDGFDLATDFVNSSMLRAVVPGNWIYTMVSAGTKSSLLLRSNGEIVAIGDNSTGLNNVPALPAGMTYTAVSAGLYANTALRSDGQAFMWGVNFAGDPPALPGGMRYVSVGGGGLFSTAVRSDGQAVAWTNSQANWAPTADADNPYIAAGGGYYYSVALKRNGQIVAWNLSNPNDRIRFVPIWIRDYWWYTAIAAGAYDAAALRNDGTITVWGADRAGILNVPGLPEGMRYTGIGAGEDFMIALRSDGMLIGWGRNNEHQLDVPPPPAGLRYTAVACGQRHALGLLSDGSVVAWGDTNSAGERDVPPVPPTFTDLGNHMITVYTPSNGSKYFEQLFTGEQDPGSDIPTWQGLVDSGGESAPVLFPIQYPEPIIDVLSPSSTAVNNPIFLVGLEQSNDPGQRYNLSVAGRNFRPGATVIFDGNPVPTRFISKSLLKVMVPADIATSVGTSLVQVLSPGPDMQFSQPAPFEVTP